MKTAKDMYGRIKEIEEYIRVLDVSEGLLDREFGNDGPVSGRPGYTLRRLIRELREEKEEILNDMDKIK